MPLSLIVPATVTVQFMSLKATELQLRDELPGEGGLHTIPLQFCLSYWNIGVANKFFIN
jgi:hypothetical protein